MGEGARPARERSPVAAGGGLGAEGAIPNVSGVAGFLAGSPVFVTDQILDDGATGDLVAVYSNLGEAYAFGDRQSLVVEADESVRRLQDQTTLYAKERIGGLPTNAGKYSAIIIRGTVS